MTTAGSMVFRTLGVMKQKRIATISTATTEAVMRDTDKELREWYCEGEGGGGEGDFDIWKIQYSNTIL